MSGAPYVTTCPSQDHSREFLDRGKDGGAGDANVGNNGDDGDGGADGGAGGGDGDIGSGDGVGGADGGGDSVSSSEQESRSEIDNGNQREIDPVFGKCTCGLYMLEIYIYFR